MSLGSAQRDGSAPPGSMWAPCVGGAVGQQLASTAYDDRLEALAGIEVPCLVVSFELDLLVPASLGRELAASIASARHVEIPGCGHGGLWERPDEMMSAIVEFLTNLDNQTS